MNYYLIRYTELILWRAATVGLGKLEEARALVNQIPERQKTLLMSKP